MSYIISLLGAKNYVIKGRGDIMFDTIAGFRKVKDHIDVSDKVWTFHMGQICYYYVRNNKIEFRYYPQSKIVYFIFSIPKLLYHTNTKMFFQEDLPLLQKKFKFETLKVLRKPMPDLLDWQVSRCDFCWNFLVNQPKDKKVYIHLIKKCQSGFFRVNCNYYKTTALFANSMTSVEVYDKEKELQRHNKNYNIKEYEKKIIRLEVRFKNSRKIHGKFGKNVVFKNVLKDNISKEILTNYLSQMCIDMKFVTQDEFFKLIRKSYAKTKSRNIIEFAEYVNHYGLKETKKKYSQGSYYRYLKDIKKLGINVFFIYTESPIQLNISIPAKRNVFPKHNFTYIYTYFQHSTYYYIDGG